MANSSGDLVEGVSPQKESPYLYRGKACIDAKWLDSEGELLESLNPVSGEAIWRGRQSDNNQVNAAVESAFAAFDAWRDLTLDERAGFVARFTDLLKAGSEPLAELIHLETGKPLWESRTEVASMIGKYAISHDAYLDRTGTSEQDSGDFSMRITHRPIGAFAVLGPYNFPGHLPNGHIVPALLAGNTLVFKPSEQTPSVGEFLVQAWLDADLPAGVLNLVQGGPLVGKALIEHPLLKGVLFTGSADAGKSIHRALAGQTDKILALELGGNNPLVVGEVADLPAAVYTILQSTFITAGQRCTCARRLILVDSQANRDLLEKLVDAASKLRVGSGEDCFMGPVISNQAADRLVMQQNQFIAQGGRALLEMKRLKQGFPLLSAGIIDVSDSFEQVDEECFGPLLKVRWAEDLDQAIRFANDTKFGLSAGLLCDSRSSWDRFYARSNAGIVNWNRPLTGASGKAPFGGPGCSGNYRPSAYYAADYCAYPVASLLQESVQLPSQLAPGVSL